MSVFEIAIGIEIDLEIKQGMEQRLFRYLILKAGNQD
jgi:hypothetical protein